MTWLAVALFSGFLAAARVHAQSPDLGIRGATVVDVADGSLHPDRTVLVAGDRIVRVGGVDEVEIPAGAEVLDAGGGYLIPGLRDMHTLVAGSVSGSQVRTPEN